METLLASNTIREVLPVSLMILFGLWIFAAFSVITLILACNQFRAFRKGYGVDLSGILNRLVAPKDADNYFWRRPLLLVSSMLMFLIFLMLLAFDIALIYSAVKLVFKPDLMIFDRFVYLLPLIFITTIVIYVSSKYKEFISSVNKAFGMDSI